jgi:carboxypeptidase Taq
MATRDAQAVQDAYQSLCERYERLVDLQQTTRLLNWDQQVMMPPEGTTARASQLSTISALSHDLLTDESISSDLQALSEADLEEDEAAVVREARRKHDRAADVPEHLVEALSTLQSEAQETWKQAKAENDFDAFAPSLVELRDLHRERATCIDPDRPPYEVLYEEAQPYLSYERTADLFEELRDGLVPLIEKIRKSDAEPAWPFEGEYDDEDQRALSNDVLDLLGYDRDRGRLDTAAHPFMSGNQFDARITTRFKASDPLDALTATIHEFGHATYQLGLPDDEYGSPLGEPRSSGVHESQSRFWENHVGRTRAFWELFHPTFVDHFPEHEDTTPEELYRAVNKVRPDNLIRVEADEVTYHMHVILRCEIDQAFVAEEIEVDEIPQLWDEKMEEYLGITPDTDAEGCLQDIHWSYGFAGFHGYTIGSVLAAQIDAAMRDDLDVDALVRDGDFEPIHEWLTERIHSQGCRYETDELIERATGEPLTAEYFLEYVEAKFGDLYDI